MLYKMNKFLFREYGQCKERFWIRMHEAQDDSTAPDEMQDFFMEQKVLIEKYAFELLSKNENISIEEQKEIETDQLKVKIDICAKYLKSGKTDIYEIYNSRGFKSHRLWDLAFMMHVLKSAGYTPGKVFAVYINPEYVRSEEGLNPEGLIKIDDVTLKVKKLLPKVRAKVEEALEFASKKEFELYPEGHHCQAKDCLALKRFHLLPETDLENTAANEIIEIPESKIKSEALQNWLQKLNYPIYFLDYEAVTANIPVYPNSKPFQHVVFQYSLHIMPAPGAEVAHFEFIPSDREYPVKKLLESLCANIADDNGSILVWHDSFEKARNKEMAALYPEFKAQLMNINSRIIDMERVFNQDGGLYLHPDFKGKSSIKKVFPVLLPDEPAYDLLDVGDGMMASILWYRYLTGTLGENYSPDLLRRQLSEYCGLDTGAMVKILEFLLTSGAFKTEDL